MVPRAVEDDRGDVVDHPFVRVGDHPDVVADRAREIDLAARPRTDRHLPHVHVGQRRHRAARRRGDHRDRVRAAARDHCASFERVEREIELLAARPDDRPGRELLGVLVRADHDFAADRHLLERLPRCSERRLLGSLLVGAPEPPRARRARPARSRARTSRTGTAAGPASAAAGSPADSSTCVTAAPGNAPPRPSRAPSRRRSHGPRSHSQPRGRPRV